MAALIRSLLIANRGEIACRIIRTARALGIRTIAVYSEADARSLHVEQADEAWPIGPAPARDSYLDRAKIIDVARRAHADAIHPGYGFLSENADFAADCAAAGIIFVGPPASAIRAMGSKSAAKSLMEAAGVPLIRGYHGAEQDPGRLAAEAEKIGFPVLIKPSAGGGGKGMKVVERAADFAESLAAARREAAASFGDERVLLERYLTQPRHIEVQIFADSVGNIVHLFERDCSIQRRHQKVVEEAPAPGLDDARRAAMYRAAIDAARAVGYVGAGTVEFIAEGDAFFFMEMNTRLQVEHPVTEAITGIDLVDWQIRVASGEPLPLGQDAIVRSGHAIEARLYAEDPGRDFLPQSGTLHHVAFPETLRVDGFVRSGDVVSIHYDPMLAKLIAHGPDRDSARNRLIAGLDACEIAGIATNRRLLRSILDHADFAAGAIDTGFIADHHAELAPRAPDGDRAALLAGLFVLLDARRQALREAAQSSDPWSPWSTGAGWRLAGTAEQHLALEIDETRREIAVGFRGRDHVLSLDGRSWDLSGELESGGRMRVCIDGIWSSARAIALPGKTLRFALFDRGETHHVSVVDPVTSVDELVAGDGVLTAPMPGRVMRIAVDVGQSVAKGAVLAVVEAMKMEHAVRAPGDGVVARIEARVGDLVEEGAVLLKLQVETAE